MRKSGILLHITSLPSPYGIGTMGKAAYEFIDLLVKAGQSAWQVLPIGHTSYGDSPYQTYSSYAGNPYLIDLDELSEDGLLERDEYKDIFWGDSTERVDYKAIFENRLRILKIAAAHLLENEPFDYKVFLTENAFWLSDYAHFMALKEMHGFNGRDTWEVSLRCKSTFSLAAADKKTVKLYEAIQYLFFRQWSKLKRYAASRNIDIIGDIPIYCASDSADVWAEPELFLLDGAFSPRVVSGCPPDAFSPLGQRWGNPIYDWAEHEKRGFSWWAKRLGFALKIYDSVKIDHFRGFESFYEIEANEKTAENGRWRKGPGKKLFKALKEKLGGDLPLIAEDLGYLTDDVISLLKYTKYPGMKVLEFGFDARESGGYLPHTYPENSVCYVGTHDNDTASGWYASITDEEREKARIYFNITEEEGISYGLMRGALASPSFLAVLQMQDILNLGSEARMNKPATEGGNWQWRMAGFAEFEKAAARLKKMTEVFERSACK